MKIKSAAIRYISIPSPKGDLFRGGLSPKKNKNKPRLLTRVLSSAPIRRMGKHMSKRSSKKSPRKDKFEKESNDQQKTRDYEQGWIAQAATFETEDTLSPRSFDSLTPTSDSTSSLLQTEQEEVEFVANCSILHTSHKVNADRYLDLETALNESADTGIIITNNLNESSREYSENTPEQCEKEDEEEKELYCSTLHSSQQIYPDQFLDLEAAVSESSDTGIIITNDLYENTLDIEYSENTPEPCDQEYEVEKVLHCSTLNSSQQIYPGQFLDLEAAENESADTGMIFRRENDAKENTQYIENTPETCEKQNAAPHQAEKNDKEYEDSSIKHLASSNHSSMNDDDTFAIEKKNSRDSIESLLSVIDTTTTIDEDNEIDSLVPAADISFFLNDEGGDYFHCVGRLSTHTDEAPPVEINVDTESISESTKSSYEEENQDHNSENKDDISTTSSHDSYMEAIESITASAKSNVERAMTIAIDEVEIKSSPHKQPCIEFEDDCYRVSFNASNALLLQAMEGASAKAKIDIERATSLALSKLNSAKSESSKSETFINKANVTAKYVSNRVLGFLFLIFFLFNFNRNSLQFFVGIQSISQSLGIDEFQYNHIALQPKSDLSIWGEMHMLVNANKTMKNENTYNIGCFDKIGCLALGNI